MQMNFSEKFRAKPGKEIRLQDVETDFTGDYDKETAKAGLEKLKEEMSEQQEKLYALNRNSVLIIFQAMDAAGKDSAIKHVMSGLNPQGCQVYSFKTPNAEEYEHDFLWRHYKALPERGRIGIHNRSHYENVLVCKVHPEYVMSENLPGYTAVDDLDKTFWKGRYESIRHFEEHLTRSGTTIIKFFLHVSEDEQKARFLERIEDPAKNWKFSTADLKERALWKSYRKAYEEAIAETSTDDSPWYIVPADKKWFTRLAISSIVTDTLKKMDLGYPELPEEEQQRLAGCREALLAEK
ncbi:MAG: polyphosphate kinase 2 family protein [Mucilaginibacter polytrichastri]|nr:polyphosphate kinase 2 family protein [Mucilaginibacter polytrichastri]